MKSGKVFSGTLKFVWAKLLVQLCMWTVVVLWVALMFLIFKKAWPVFLILSILGGTSIVRLIKHYILYIIKAAHVAVVAEALDTGNLPDNMYDYGKTKVKEKFVSVNVFFVVDNLVNGAIKQLQKLIGKVGELLSFIPGGSAITNIAQIFVSICLGYVDECCLGYSFNKKEQGTFKSSCDAVVLYFQNWKEILKTSLKATLIYVLVNVVSFVLLYLLLSAFISSTYWFISIVIAFSIVACVKNSFVDSYMMITMMGKFMEVAKTTEIKVDLYEKFCGMSKKFKELFNKGRQEEYNKTPSVSPAGV